MRILAFLLFASTVFAQPKPHIELAFSIGDETKHIVLRCGIDSLATEGLDLQLGEYPIPGHPPDGFHAGWEITTDGITDLSYVDFRPYPDIAPQERFSVTYGLNVSPKFYGRGDLLIIAWEYPLPRGIDSVVMTDRAGGAIARVVFGPQRADTIRGSAVELERFLVRVYYSPARAASVALPIESGAFASGFGEIVVPLPQSPADVQLYTLTGKQFPIECTYDGALLHCQMPDQNGWYLLTIRLPDGKHTWIPLYMMEHSTFVSIRR
jgi:hypothetical protein